MAELYRRAWAVQVGTLRIAGGDSRDTLDCAFEIEKSTKREPNTLSLKIWNLSRDHRRALDGSSNLTVSVEAGYEGATSILFDGDVRVAESRRRARAHRKKQTRLGWLGTTADLVDIITEIEAEDGGTAYRTATVQQSFGPSTPVSSVLRACVDAMGIGTGNLSEIGAGATLGDLSSYTEGTVLSGLANRELDRIVRSCGLTWSVQNGALQLRQGGHALATTAVRLSPESGLVGSPSVDADGYVTALSLLNGGLDPGRPVVLQSRDIEGSYQVKRVKHTADTAAEDWHSEVTLEDR